jgi:dolichol-phosphate mannosyltransferase
MWLDADGSMDVESSKRIIQTYFSENCNAVVGSRFVDGGGYKGKTKEGFSLKIFGNLFKSEDSLIAVFLSNILNRVLSRLLAVPVKDLTSGFIIIQKNFLKYEMFKGFNYGEYFISLILELTKKDAKIIEVGYVCKPRKYGQSKTSTNFIKLAKLSIPYLFLAIKSRKILYENN